VGVDAVTQVAAPALSPAVSADLVALEDVLRQRVYGHSRLRAADARAQDVVVALFAAYARRPAELPPRFAQRVPAQGLERVIADYLAGMTDRFCLAEYGRMGGPATERRSDGAT
jgi:dGTPase